MAATGKRSKSVRERLAQSIRKTPQGPVELTYGDIVVFGMEKVGKTSIISRFVNNYFSRKYVPTSSLQTFEVSALIECEKAEEEKAGKKKMVFKKSFKKSVMSKPLKSTTTMKRVLTVSNPAESSNSGAYDEGKAKGLKTLKFNLVDTPAEMVEMEPVTYQATICNAKGFLLVCAFDVEGSLEYIKDRFDDIQRMRSGIETPIILIANKSDLEEKLWEEHEINTMAAQLKAKYCISSVATKEGCEAMTEIMLNEINVFAEEESFQNSLPEDYVYYDRNDEKDIGSF